MADLAEILVAANSDSDVWSVLLTSAVPGVFSSGADISGADISDPAIGFNELAQAVYNFSKLLAVAVPGLAVGVAVTILPHADLVWCTEDATFFTPFGRLALVPEMASSVTFPALMGPSLATEVLLGGRTLSAQDALRCGLVSAVLPSAAALEAEALRCIGHILELPSAQRSIAVFKRVLGSPRAAAVQEAHTAEVAILRTRFADGEPFEAVMRFMSERGQPRL